MENSTLKKQTQPARGHLHKLEWVSISFALVLLLTVGFGILASGQTTLAHFGLNNNYNVDMDNVVGTPTAVDNSLTFSNSNPDCEGSYKAYADNNGEFLDIFINVSGFSSIEISWQQRAYCSFFGGCSSGRWNLSGDIDADGSFEYSKTDNPIATDDNCTSISASFPVLFDNQSNLRIRFQMADYSGSAVYLDDITISGTPLPTCPIITPHITFTDINCFGDNDGSITIESIDGGTPPYVYSIDNGETYTETPADPPFTFNDLLANEVYRVRVKDSDDCESSSVQ